MMARGKRRYTHRFHGRMTLSALALLVALSTMALSRMAAAQYVDPPEGGGYLDGPQAYPGPPDDFMAGPPEPMVRLGAGLSLGAGYTDFEQLDLTYLAPNAAEEFGAIVPLALDFAFWLQFGPHFRLGIQGDNQLAGSGANFTHDFALGFLLEGGLPIDELWSAWGGAVLGYEWLYAESKDVAGRRLEYWGDYLHLGLQASIERKLLPFLGLRGTLFYQFGNLLREDFDSPGGWAEVPVETDFDRHTAGLVIGLTLGF